MILKRELTIEWKGPETAVQILKVLEADMVQGVDILIAAGDDAGLNAARNRAQEVLAKIEAYQARRWREKFNEGKKS